MSDSVNGTIYPVIFRVSENLPSGKNSVPELSERTRRLSRLARRAAVRSATFAKAPSPAFMKNAGGVPKPASGRYWSISHKPEFVTGIVAPFPVGIDIEKIRPIRPELHRKIATNVEWRISTAPPEVRFFLFWTAKEAVLKAVGKGFAGLPDCRINHVIDPFRMRVSYKETVWKVTHLFFSDHVAAVAVRQGDIVWKLAMTRTFRTPKKQNPPDLSDA